MNPNRRKSAVKEPKNAANGIGTTVAHFSIERG
jgi:hypothetical protein